MVTVCGDVVWPVSVWVCLCVVVAVAASLFCCGRVGLGEVACRGCRRVPTAMLAASSHVVVVLVGTGCVPWWAEL